MHTSPVASPARDADLTMRVPNAIEVQNVGKQFRISYRGSLKHQFLHNLLSAVQPHRVQEVRTFVALKDISFCVPHGQTVAVIGRNGSGKSTLLSLLAHVYKPTTGVVRLLSPTGGRPRIAPLLELGAGFHPDLTGLENMDFYGALLGMTPREIDERQDEIIEFAELGDKVKTPLRGWNSGAMLRLGFSIAIYTDPDILLVDEILAVGDEAFQKKCTDRIAAMQAAGKTILFVSHSLPTVERVAERVIWLHMGTMRMDGDTQTVLKEYREAAKQGL